MPAFQKYQTFVVRYVPDLIKEEFLNIGVGLRCQEKPYDLLLRWEDDLRYILCRHTGTDLEYLRGTQIPLFENEMKNVIDPASVQNRRPSEFDPFTIGLLPPIETADPEAEIERLRTLIVKSAKKSVAKRRQTRINKLLEFEYETFRQAGVLGLMDKKIPAARYTWSSHTLKFDCGYLLNGLQKLFHAFPQEKHLATAQSLLTSYPALQKGIRRVENASIALTAIVEDEMDRNNDELMSALDAITASGMTVLPASALPELAETARQELMA